MPPVNDQPTTLPKQGIKWNEINWYSRLGAIIVLVGILPALSFYVGTQYQSVLIEQDSLTDIARFKELMLQTPNSDSNLDTRAPAVSGYYTLLPDATDGTYILITQSGETVGVEGHAVRLNSVNQSKYFGDFIATSTVSHSGAAVIKLNSNCTLSLLFNEKHLIVHESAAGLICPFGNEVTFTGEYERQNKVPDPLPQRPGA